MPLPIDRVGVYVPGGQAAYPSTVLMTVIPARVAGVRDVTVMVPTPDGVRSQLVLAALYVASVDRVYTLGGAQAIGALAFGTETISKVDKIVGPGGAFVAAAKRLVFGPVGIDVIAGPSEILIIADGSSPPRWAALDLFSQAEHDATAQAILLSPDAGFLDAVMAEMQELIAGMDREVIIRRSLADRGALIRTRDLAEAVDISNGIAPEHLELAVADPDALLAAVKHACAGTEIDDMVGALDRLLVMLDDHDGVADVAHALERCQQATGVSLMEPDGWLIEDIDHAREIRADLTGQADALRLAPGQGRAGPIEG